MGAFDGIKGIFKDETEYFETEELEQQIEKDTDDTFKVEVAGTSVSRSSKSIVKIYEPTTRATSNLIIDSLKRGELCVVNLAKMTEDDQKALYSTLSGSVYSLDGTLNNIDNNIIVCGPRNFLVDSDLSE